MDYRFALIILGDLVTLLAFCPYIIGIIKRQVKPRIASWLVWTIITMINSLAAISDGQIVTGIFAATLTIGNILVLTLGWEFGSRELQMYDKICVVFALLGIVLWLLLDSPNLAIAAAILVDFIACIPTLVHVRQKPSEESFYKFLMMFSGSILILAAQTSLTFSAIAYPAYLILANGVITILIWRGSQKYNNHRILNKI